MGSSLVSTSNSAGSYYDGVYIAVSLSSSSSGEVTQALLDWTFTDNTISGNNDEGIDIDLSLDDNAFLKLTALFDGNTVVDNGRTGVTYSAGDGIEVSIDGPSPPVDCSRTST